MYFLKDFVTVHIRAAGNWTNQCYDYFQNEIKSFQNGGATGRATMMQRYKTKNSFFNVKYFDIKKIDLTMKLQRCRNISLTGLVGLLDHVQLMQLVVN